MRTPHIVPLSKQTLAVPEQLKKISFGRDFVFPNDLNPSKQMSNNTLLYALYRGYRGRMTGQGFRGVASTILHEQGWPLRISRHAGPAFHLMPGHHFTSCRASISPMPGHPGGVDFTNG